MNNDIIAIVDVDDVTAELMGKWLEVYNKEYEDSVEKSQITDWAVHEFVKPLCGRKFYNYLTKKLYNDISPIEGALDGINKLRQYAHVVFVTSFIPKTAGAKYEWLLHHGFLDNSKDYVETYSKGLIKADILIDDGWHNIQSFKGHLPILYNQPWNEKYKHHFRAKDWNGVIDLVRAYYPERK